ncbi:DUF6786 family protein [Paraglaciecola sp. L3A3]|uniref:DUF6786 family protein n=1 Tax=Paraglaciecola sp. L3A3 TaxID=2686358 RepID=UPI00131C2657|nr:DUF6786 family protein [Paraglaciecola sp. L3A3]
MSMFSMVRKDINWFVRLLITTSLVAYPVASKQTFNQAIQQLSIQHKPIILKQGKSRAAVLAEFQGRVMVTSADGELGQTLGWSNFEYLATPNTDNNSVTGGASRLWFGPETGPYSVFFKPGKPRTVNNIQVQDAVSLQPFTLIAQSDSVANFKQNISIQNHFGFTFELSVERKIELFAATKIAENLSIDLDDNLSVVGFSARTEITNISQHDWRKGTGLLSIWELGAFEPSDTTVIFIPIKGQLAEVTSYFTPTKTSHAQIKNGVVYYKADAHYMNKIGIPAANATDLMGSYDKTAKLLTIFEFQLNSANELYNNSVWYEENYHPYKGDVINVFNDGLVDGEGPFGPFYELETSSSARELKVGQSQQHFQNTYHFQGDEKHLNKITKKLFGLSLNTALTVFSD